MSKESHEDQSLTKSLWNDFFQGNLEGRKSLIKLDEDENDEDYCFVEDKIENFSHYRNDILPYEFSIPKKEINDVINDRDKYI